jgi:hypothetical protein
MGKRMGRGCRMGDAPAQKAFFPAVPQDVPQISRSVPPIRAKGFFGQKHSPLI